MADNEQVHPVFRRILDNFKKGHLSTAEAYECLRKAGLLKREDSDADAQVGVRGTGEDSTGTDVQEV